MSSNPLARVAVLMAVYSGDIASQLIESVNSLLEDTRTPVDIHIYKDGPISEDLQKALSSLEADNKIFRVVDCAENHGLAYGLNQLLNSVQGSDYEYLARMDADDVSVRERVHIQVEYLDAHPEVDMLGGWIVECNIDTGSEQVIQVPSDHSSIVKYYLKRNPFAHVTMMFRKRVFENGARYSDSYLNEDYELWGRLLKQGFVAHNLDEILVRVTTGNNFYARRQNWRRAKELLELRMRYANSSIDRIRGLILGLSHMAIFMAPGPIKLIGYRFLRK